MLRIVASFLLALACCAALAAEQTSEAQAPARRPKIGLVLGGGGAKGISHIGVIKVLEELHVPVDYIAGTSMGSLVGGAYASGMSSDEMARFVTGLDWARVFRDLPPRQDQSVYLKRLSQENLWPLVLGIGRDGVSFPSGAIAGQQLGFALDKLAAGAAGARTFDELEIPYRAVATNALTGKMVVFDRGDLARVMRASMSVPGVFAPAQIGDGVYFDGGLVRNLPVDVVRAMGADVVIAVTLETPLATRDQLNNALTVTVQMIDILMQQNVQGQLETLTDADVQIHPDLDGYGSASFDQAAKLIPLGEKAARAMADKLKRYSLPADEYLALRAEQHARRRPSPPLEAVRIDTARLRFVNPQAVEAGLRLPQGQPVDIDELTRRVDVLYGTGDYERIAYDFEYQGEGRVLEVQPVEKPEGPNYLRFGLQLSTDFKGDNDFALLANFTMTWLNSLGAQWRNDIGLGSPAFFRSEFYQPLSVAGPWFVAPSIFGGRGVVNFFDGDNVADQVRENRLIGALDVGATLEPKAQIRAGVFTGKLNADPTVTTEGLTPTNAGLGGYQFGATYDSRDNAGFPHQGTYLRANLMLARTGLGSALNYQKADLNWLSAWSIGRNTVQLALRGGSGYDGDLPFYELYSLGGFLNLSGYRTNQLQGQSVALGRLMYYNRFADLGLVGSVYAGFSLEAGNVYGPFTGTTAPTGLQYAGALFLGADTVIGPAYLAYGHSQEGPSAFYLYIGYPYR
ncbi:MAG TPA: patatin-like phospholipase family protein [Burkholderiales bacterium]|nr:patatin-like phospholipase family protein [Burkholderiales bacterium]